MKRRGALLSILFLGCAAGPLLADDPSFEVYGYVMLDAGYDTKQVHPDWFDVLRVTKLPSSEAEENGANGFPGSDGHAYFSVRQTRLGVRSSTPTAAGDLKTTFEFELFGVGVDAGQTTFRLRHAYGELGKWGAGQYWSPFMDIDVFPNTIEYWGPTGMVFFRNVQIRYMPIQGDSRMTVALERPGASHDAGIYSARVELQDVNPHFPLPDLSAEYRHAAAWGYVELAGIARWIEWEDAMTDEIDLSGDAVGWGLNASSNLKIGDKNTVRLQVVYGEGIQNYMNDAPADVAIQSNPGAEVPVEGVAIPLLGGVAFLDHTWSEKFTTSVGYSMIDVDNTDGQADNAFSRGHYAVGNLLYYPAPSVMTGVELQYGKRDNFVDDYTSDDVKIQVSFRYNFSKMM